MDIKHTGQQDKSDLLSVIREGPILVKVDKHVAKRYRVIEEIVDLDALESERNALLSELNAPEPSIKELIECGRYAHPYYVGREWKEARLAEIEAILGEIVCQ